MSDNPPDFTIVSGAQALAVAKHFLAVARDLDPNPWAEVEQSAASMPYEAHFDRSEGDA